MTREIINKTNISVIFRFLLSGGQQVVGLVLGVVLARILSPSEFGVMAVANMIIFYANSFSNFGLNNALVQKSKIDNTHINTVFTLNLLVSLFLSFFTIIFSKWIAHIFNCDAVESVLKWMSLYYIITSFSAIPTVLLRRDINFKFLSIVEFFQNILGSIFTVILAINGFSYWSIVISSLVCPVISIFILSVKVQWIPKIAINSGMGDIFTFGFWSFIGNQVELLVSKIDYFVIGKYLNLESLGLYEKGFELTSRAMNGMTMPINSVYYSTFCRLSYAPQQVKIILLKSITLVALVSYPALFGLIGVAPHFVISCMGEQWARTIVPMQILATACIFRVPLGMLASVNVAMGKQKMLTLVSIFTASIFIFICFNFVEYGIEAICISYLFYCFISFVSSFCIIYKNLDLDPIELLISIWCPVIGSFLMLSCVYLSRKFYFFNYNSFLQLMCLIIIGALFYLLWSFFFYKIGYLKFMIENN